MSNNQNTINNTVVISTDDAQKMADLLAYIQQNGVTPDMLKQIAKQQKDNFNYIDAANRIATCNGCGEEFNTDDIPATFLDACRKQGICPKCAAVFAQAEMLRANLKNKNITSHGSKIVVNGGKSVGKRLQAMFADAIASEQFNEDMLNQFLDNTYSNQVLKFSSYPFCVDVTDVSEAEIKDNKDFYKRFYSRVYEILGHKIRLCSQIFDAQLAACQKEFTKLGLIDKEY